MYEKLIKNLREKAESFDYDGWVETAIMLEEAADAIKELSKPRWIPVEDRLPEHAYGEGDSVMTVSSLGNMRVLYFDGGNWCYPTGEALTTEWKFPITHWMPLPQPPKEGENND